MLYTYQQDSPCGQAAYSVSVGGFSGWTIPVIIAPEEIYDASGERVKEVAGSTTTVFMYQGTNVIYYKAGSTATKLYYADGMQIARITGSTTYYYLQDELGSVRMVMSGGKITFQTDYSPYGPLQNPTGSDPFGYSDKLLDTATGMYYSSARFYDPMTWEWLIGVSGGERAYPIDLEDGSVIRADVYNDVSNRINEAKVGDLVNKEQLGHYAEAIGMGKVNPGFYYGLLSPMTGEFSPKPGYALEAMSAIGFHFIPISWEW